MTGEPSPASAPDAGNERPAARVWLARFRAWRHKHRHRLTKVFATFCIVILTDIIVDKLNPFGIDDAIKARASAVMELVMAPFYGGGYPTAGQSAVTVVLIDDRYMEKVARSQGSSVWPLPTNILTLGVLRPIIDAKPRALFVDMTFPDMPREISGQDKVSRDEAIDALGERLEQVAQRAPKVPIFLADALAPPRASGEDGEDCDIQFIPDREMRDANQMSDRLLDKLFPVDVEGKETPSKIAIVDASWPGGSDHYHLAPARTGTGGNCKVLEREREGFIASPALAMFKTYMERCDEPGSEPSICRRDRTKALAEEIRVSEARSAEGLHEYWLGEKASEGMSLRWGVGLTPTMARFFKTAGGADNCIEQFYSGKLDALGYYGLNIFNAVREAFDHEHQRRCVYIDTISAADLGDQRESAECASDGGAGACDIAGAFLKDRLVLLGVQLPQVSDHIDSPINGQIPGVYLHAVALENLLTQGDRFHDAEPSTGRWLIVMLLAGGLSALMELFWDWLWAKPAENGSIYGRFPAWARYLIAPVAYVAVALAAGTIVMLLLWSWTLPITELAVPIIAVHTILFGGIIVRWKKDLEKAFERLPWLAGAPEDAPAEKQQA